MYLTIIILLFLAILLGSVIFFRKHLTYNKLKYIIIPSFIVFMGFKGILLYFIKILEWIYFIPLVSVAAAFLILLIKKFMEGNTADKNSIITVIIPSFIFSAFFVALIVYDLHFIGALVLLFEYGIFEYLTILNNRDIIINAIRNLIFNGKNHMLLGDCGNFSMSNLVNKSLFYGKKADSSPLSHAMEENTSSSTAESSSGGTTSSGKISSSGQGPSLVVSSSSNQNTVVGPIRAVSGDHARSQRIVPYDPAKDTYTMRAFPSTNKTSVSFGDSGRAVGIPLPGSQSTVVQPSGSKLVNSQSTVAQPSGSQLANSQSSHSPSLRNVTTEREYVSPYPPLNSDKAKGYLHFRDKDYLRKCYCTSLEEWEDYQIEDQGTSLGKNKTAPHYLDDFNCPDAFANRDQRRIRDYKLNYIKNPPYDIPSNQPYATALAEKLKSIHDRDNSTSLPISLPARDRIFLMIQARNMDQSLFKLKRSKLENKCNSQPIWEHLRELS